MISIQFEGLEKIYKSMDPDNFQRKMGEAVWEISELLMNTVQGNMPDVSAKTTGYGAKGIPADTGRLKASISRRKLRLLGAEVYAGTNYSKIVHDEGNQKTGMPARPFFLWALEDFGAIQKGEKILLEYMGEALKISVV